MSQVGQCMVLFDCLSSLMVSCRFARWKRDAQYWFKHDSLMFERLLGKVVDDLVRAVLAMVVHREMNQNYQLQRDGTDRPSFGATVLNTGSKYGLLEREKPWLAGNMLYVPQPVLLTQLESEVSPTSVVLQVKRQRLLRFVGGFSPCSRIPLSKPGPMPSSTRS